MKLIVYDTFSEYIASGSNLKDDLCYIKDMDAGYQGGHQKDKKKPKTSVVTNNCGCSDSPCGCGQTVQEKPFIHPEECEDECSCDCNNFHSPLSIAYVDDIRYGTGNNRLITDCEGNFIPVTGDTIPGSSIENYINNYINRLVGQYITRDEFNEALARKQNSLNLATLTIDGNTYRLDTGSNIVFCTPGCSSPEPTSYSVIKHAENCTIYCDNNVVHGGSLSVIITPDSGCTITSRYYLMNGVRVNIDSSTFTINNVTGKIDIYAIAVENTPTPPGPTPVEKTIYLAFSDDNVSIPNYALSTSAINNTLVGTFDIDNPTIGYSLHIGAPAGVSVPNIAEVVKIDGTSAGFTQVTDIKAVGVYESYVVYGAFFHTEDIPARQNQHLYTFKFI